MRALLSVVILATGLVAGGLLMEYRSFLSKPVTLGEDRLVFEVERGTSLRALSETLERMGLLEHPYFFMAMAYFTDKATAIKAGEYEIRSGITPPDLLALLTSGKVVQRAFTLVEGWTYRQVLDALAKDTRFANLLGDEPTAEMVMAKLGHPEEHPEGRFFPETYYFAKGASDLDVLRRSYETMKRVLAEEWEKRDEGLPLRSPYEALILSSIVEKETGLAPERPIIAGVFVRRLTLGMKLQTDPTVIYGLGERFAGDITRAHLRQDNPYNTYVREGLPPTPIALPGRDAINAVLHPRAGDSLYFVAKGDGSHHFSANLAEHNEAVRRYQLRKP
ncbi:MAG: endolytic transglycosylase MltG [Chromatiaceae bacterium]|nr:endolytic transglycosylase MltG [Chromatiaceae bacterium]